MALLSQDKIIAGNQALEHYFSKSVVPQLYIDPKMTLKSFTAPAEDLFLISSEDIGKSIFGLQNKIKLNALIKSIRCVLLVEKTREKIINTSNGKLCKLIVQPYFDEQDERIMGVIVTFRNFTGQAEQ
ncbi:hypothetical protein GCM10007103_19150 [Salinimicrobium marinum]|uniref:PAS domain-containing protein n=1 Tax=Salinimicrobium marinum TaxID=680283 RepID=A0A918SFF9_9FLAO|nr:PAS domain-containing protein [Salinimicrobium marinum]GHA37785.1 hypothetical protein GCM10007103_19150 [Salinimicrobium marinum]